jgi:hypothetical protein
MPASGYSPANLWDKIIAPYLDKYCLLVCVFMVAVACARIISTYSELSLTTDEPFHFACAIEYLGKHSFVQDLENPPVARAAQALGPYLLLGARPVERSDAWQEAVAIIALSGNYHRTVFLLRLGTLPFFLLACVVVGCWSGRAFGKPVAVIAVGLFTLLPTTLADAGLHTTDMALGASVGAAFLATILWAEKPTWLRALLLGACTALAVLSKFSALGYVPLAAVLALACYWFVRRPGWQELRQLTRQHAGTFLLAAATTMLLVWAAYLFSFGAVRLVHDKIFILPAPEFFAGLRVVREHVRRGHSAFLLGETGRYGWWYYYPIALLVKLPIAFLIMSAMGVYVCLRERARPAYLLPLAFCVAILLPAMTGPIDIGLRHIEPIYVGLSIIAALGLVQLLQAIRTNLIAGLTAAALVAWMIVSVAVHHPDYLAYFNGFAGRHPENVLVDSNYDWGQELISLSRRLHQLEVKKFSLACMEGVQNYQYMQAWYGLPQIRGVDPRVPSPGWNVICPTVDKALRSETLNGVTGVVPWYDQMAPTERLGPLSLYYIPPRNPTGSSPESGSSNTPFKSWAPSASESH